ncbi:MULTISPECIES: AMP-binding protein [Nioella]|uniref:AMP-binding protein n=1 Tax=Nioella TaxID=1775424 RepID=UPI0009FC0FFB|nr:MULTISPECIES: AMP-binding protein [Nioella]
MGITPSVDVIHRVQSHVLQHPDRTAFVFMQRRAEAPLTVTWAELWSRAAAIAAALPAPATDRPLGCLLFCRNASQFVTALLAVWMRGGVGIPGSSVLTSRIVERNSHVIRAARPDVILHDLAPDEVARLRAVAGPAMLIRIEDGMQGACDVAAAGGLLQFSSGTTANPKPILVGPRAIAANAQAIVDRFALTADSVGVHWLPLHHDMGLVGGVIAVFWMGCTSVLMPPTMFIQEPLSWFRAVDTWRGTITSAPNFAYARLIDEARKEPPAGMDLTCLQNLIIGGEPVQRSTIDGLQDFFGPLGLSPDAIAPSYGMAEATLLVSSGKRAGGPRLCHRDGRDLVSLGAPVRGLSVTIGPGAAPYPDGVIGPVVISGSSLGQVVGEQADWRRLTPDGDLPPMETGDYGYRHAGEIFLTGRSANKIIIRGKNVFAEDVEQIALDVAAGAIAGGAAAFAVAAEGTEQLCLVLEMPRAAEFEHLPELNTRIGEALGIKLHRVVVVSGACLPRTSSGKIQRTRARDMLAEGAFEKRIRLDVSQSAH